MAGGSFTGSGSWISNHIFLGFSGASAGGGVSILGCGAWCGARRGLVSVFREFSTSFGGAFILAGVLVAGLSFMGFGQFSCAS